MSQHARALAQNVTDKFEDVLCRAAGFVLNFYDYHSSDDLGSKIKKSKKWASLQHSRADTDLCMFYRIRKNFANIAIPPMLVESIKHNCHYSNIQSHYCDVLNTNILSDGTPLLTIWQLNHLFSPSMLQSFSGSHPYDTGIQSQLDAAWFKLLLTFSVVLSCCLQCYHCFLLYLSNVCLPIYLHFYVKAFIAFLQ